MKRGWRWRAERFLARRPLAIEFILGHDLVAAGAFGEIERAVAAIDQIAHRLARLKLPDADRDRDVGQHLAGRAAGERAHRDRAADALRGRAGSRELPAPAAPA